MGKSTSKELKNFDKAIEANPEDSELYYKKGVALDNLKKNSDALFNFERAIQINPKYADAWHAKGKILYFL